MHVLPGILGFEKISKVFLVIESEKKKKMKKLSRLRIESWTIYKIYRIWIYVL